MEQWGVHSSSAAAAAAVLDMLLGLFAAAAVVAHVVVAAAAQMKTGSGPGSAGSLASSAAQHELQSFPRSDRAFS